MQTILLLCSMALALGHPQGYNYQQTFGGQQMSSGVGNSYNQNVATNQNVYKPTAAHSYNQKEESSQTSSGSQTYNEASTQSVFKPNFVAQFQPSFGYQASQPSVSTNYQPQQSTLFSPNTQYSQEPAYSVGQQQAFLEANDPNYGRPTVTKDIFVHVAPRELEQYQQPRYYPQPPPRKHYRIVFIKAPSPPSAAALQVQQAPVEEKTIIYVLTKKADPIDIQALQEAAKPTQIHKPEVYFIKYKTQEEAKQAQLSIQAEYDKLGGTSQVSDEGIAPVTSVIGAFENKNNEAQTNPGIDLRSGFASNVSPVSTNYLPPHQKRA